MAYPYDLLGEDEYVVVHRHPHWKTLVGAVLTLLVVAGGGSYVAAMVARTDWRGPAWLALGIIGGVLLIWRTLGPLMRWKTTHFVVTTHRLMMREGVLTRSGIDIPMSRINSVRFQHGLLDRILGTGTLIVESASDEPLEFHDIPSVERVHTLLYREVHGDSRDDYRDWREQEL